LFIGRQLFLDDLRERFRKARAANPTAFPNHLIHGIGGVGKTRTAVEYGLQFREHYTALLFVNGETASDLDRSLSDLAGVLTLNLPAEASSPEKLRAVLSWLKARPGWLLIVDNVDDEKARDAVNGLLKEWHNGHVLITGRYLRWGKDVEPLELTVLAPNDARDFLLKGTDGRRQVQPGDAELAKAIAVEDLGQLCLALEQASAYIAHREISFAEYQKRWQANAREVRTWADKVLMKYHEEKAVSLSIATTWQTSMDQLSPDARRLLEMLSWLSPDPLPRTIFQGIEKAGGLTDTEPLVIELRSFSLLQRATEATFDSPGKVHRLVQLITREQLEAPRESLSAILAAVKSVTPARPDDVRTWPLWNPLQPHIAVVIQHADSAGLTNPTSFLMVHLGLLLKSKALYADAEPLIRT
jgi:hypothetical protein